MYWSHFIDQPQLKNGLFTTALALFLGGIERYQITTPTPLIRFRKCSKFIHINKSWPSRIISLWRWHFVFPDLFEWVKLILIYFEYLADQCDIILHLLRIRLVWGYNRLSMCLSKTVNFWLLTVKLFRLANWY